MAILFIRLLGRETLGNQPDTLSGLRVAFLNENVGGHATFHADVMAELAQRSDVQAVRFDLSPPSFLHRMARGSVPFLAGRDADFALFRAQLLQSAAVARPLRRLAETCDVLHFYTQNGCPMLTPGRPHVVMTDVS